MTEAPQSEAARRASPSTLYFDGSCPLCRTEVAYYRRQDAENALCFIDVSDANSPPPRGVTREGAMARFHVRAGDGRVLSGAAAFVEVWRRLPRWRWAARFAMLPGVTPLMEFGYRLFLPVRPWLSRAFAALVTPRSRSAADQAH